VSNGNGRAFLGGLRAAEGVCFVLVAGGLRYVNGRGKGCELLDENPEW
jgi:hypothetical protein